MHVHIYADAGNVVMELDSEGIDFFIEGLLDLRTGEPGDSLGTPTLAKSGMARFYMRRVEDSDEPFEGWNGSNEEG